MTVIPLRGPEESYSRMRSACIQDGDYKGAAKFSNGSG